jgi:proteasome lid subunit RPN8/RPN11
MYNRGMAVTAIRFTDSQFNQMLAHVLADPAREMCGLLSGREEQVEAVLPVPNVLHSPVAYLMDGQEFADAMVACDFEPLGIFHSHIAGPPTPSPTDVAQAMYPEAVYVIISLHPSPPSVRAFRIVDHQVTEVELLITDRLPA